MSTEFDSEDPPRDWLVNTLTLLTKRIKRQFPTMWSLQVAAVEYCGFWRCWSNWRSIRVTIIEAGAIYREEFRFRVPNGFGDDPTLSEILAALRKAWVRT